MYVWSLAAHKELGGRFAVLWPTTGLESTLVTFRAKTRNEQRAKSTSVAGMKEYTCPNAT